MDEIIFEWDPRKAESNERKHGISFEEAETAFYDPAARVSYDPDHSQEEDRYILLGISETSKLLTVVHLYLHDDEYVRIISARRATKAEQRQYEGFCHER
jgi:uncharacterized protein